jgi:hypothetical protein
MEEGTGVDNIVNGQRTIFRAYPFYITQPDSCNVVVVKHISDNLGGGIYGNTGYLPPTFPIRVTYQEIQSSPTNPELPLLEHRTSQSVGEFCSPEKDRHRFAIKRNARFPAWKKDPSNRPLLAIIYETERGWGPIEIRDPGFWYRPPKRGEPGYPSRYSPRTKPDVWEISFYPRTCDGLDWGLDGSLACLSEGKVFSFSSQQIIQGIEASGVGQEQTPNTIDQPKQHWHWIPINNVFKIEPNVIANGIHGDQFRWIADKTFLFRNKSLFIWNDGKVKELCQAPMNFSYCFTAPPKKTAVEQGTVTSK